MTLTESQKQARYNYAKKSLKRIPLDVQKEKYEEIKAAAEAVGESINGYIKKAIDERMEKDGALLRSPASAVALLSDRRPEASTEEPAEAPEAKRLEEDERKKSVLPLTSENIAKVDLDRLVDDFRYQIDIGDAFGMDSLSKLLDIARKERLRVKKSGSSANNLTGHLEHLKNNGFKL